MEESISVRAIMQATYPDTSMEVLQGAITTICTESVRIVEDMVKRREIPKDDQQRWTGRILLEILTAHTVEYWEGKCMTCGVKVSKTNEANRARTRCFACEEVNTPVPKTHELLDIIFSIWPDARISPRHLTLLEGAELKSLSLWLTKVCRGDTPGVPPVVIKLGGSSIFGDAIDKKDYFPRIEVGEGGKLPDTHHVQRPEEAAFDAAVAELDAAKADLERAIDTSAFPEEVHAHREKVKAMEAKALAAKEAMEASAVAAETK